MSFVSVANGLATATVSGNTGLLSITADMEIELFGYTVSTPSAGAIAASASATAIDGHGWHTLGARSNAGCAIAAGAPAGWMCIEASSQSDPAGRWAAMPGLV